MFKTIALFGKLMAMQMTGTYEVQETDFDSFSFQDAYYATAPNGSGVAFYDENVMGAKSIKKGDTVTVIFLPAALTASGEEELFGVIKR